MSSNSLKLGNALLHHVSRIATSDLSVDEILGQVMGLMSQASDCDACLVYLLEFGTGEFVLRASQVPRAQDLASVRLKPGEGITGWVAQHQLPVALSTRAGSDSRSRAFTMLVEDTYEALLSVPLISQGKTVGVVNVHHRDEHQHLPEEIALISFIGEQMGSAIAKKLILDENCRMAELEIRMERHRVQLEQEVLRRTKELTAINQELRISRDSQELIATLGQSALANSDLNHLFSEAGIAVAEGLNVGFSKVMAFAVDDHSFIVKAGMGWEPAWLGERISPADGGIRLSEILAGMPSIIDDFLTERPVSTSAILRAHGISSGVAVAIVCNEGPWGVVGAYSRDVRKFGTEHVNFLKSIANILATGIDRRRREEQLIHLAHYDPLTNLPNKALFNDRLEAAIMQSKHSGRRTAVLCLDLDRFKNVNDAFGHRQGDRLLREIARRLSSLTRASDTLSRPGGDEFLVLMPGMEIGEDPARDAEQMIRSLDADVDIGFDEAVLVTCSIGIACFPHDGKDAETLLRNAEAAMYAAKTAGRNSYRFYSEEMNARAHERLLLEADLGKAIARGELFLQFQPQIAIASGVATGMEALTRWRHPALGLVPPGRFIPVAEECGLIVPIGNWVLEAACRQQAQWVREGIAHGRVAVNVSAIQFRQSAFLGSLFRLLSERASMRAISNSS